MMDAKTVDAIRAKNDPADRAERVRAMNGLSSPAGAGGCGDRGQGSQIQPARTFMALNRELTRWYYSNWAARKGIDIPVEDMLREPWTYEGLDEQQSKMVNTSMDLLGVVTALGQAMRLERLLGGSVILMGVEGDSEDASEPLDPSTVDKGDLKFLNVIPRNRITQTNFSNDPLQANFGRPETFTINGATIHRSRLLIFDGNPIAPNNAADLVIGDARRRNDGFGDSVMEAVLDDLTYATGARQAAFQLINQASIWLIETDLLSLQETKEGDARISELERLSEQASLYRAAIMDNGGESRAGSAMSSISPSFGSVPELMISYLQVLSAAWDIPATRYIGQAPGGLNATGDSDLENYYNQIESKQRQRLRPQLMKLLDVLLPSVFGRGRVDMTGIDVIFEPLWNLSETELSTVRLNDSQSLVALSGTGAISSTEVEAEARERGVLIATPVEDGIDEIGGAPDLLSQLDRLAGMPGGDILTGSA